MPTFMQVGDLEPELPVDGRLHGGVSGADHVTQVAEAVTRVRLLHVREALVTKRDTLRPHSSLVIAIVPTP